MKGLALHLVVVLLLVMLMPGSAQPGGGGGDTQVLFKAWDMLRQQNAAVEKANPQQAIDAYTKFLNETAHNNPTVAIVAVEAIGHLYAYNLKDTDKAVAAFEVGRKDFSYDPRLVLLTDEGRVLMDGGRGAEAIQLFQAHETQIFQSYVTPAQETLKSYVQALLAAGQDAKALEVVTRALINYPDLAEPIPYWDWLYKVITNIAVRQGHPAAALSWARWRFMVTSCQDEALIGTGRTLTNAWKAVDPTGQAQLSFVVALHDPTRPNPLLAIPLPVMNPQYLAELAARRADSPRYPETIHLDLITGRLNAAMQEALKLLENRQTVAVGMREVCRVFKAADLNFKRANEFLNFFKTGDGDDPLEAFFLEHPAAADPAPGVAPPAAVATTTANGQLPQAIRLQLVALNNMVGDNATSIVPLNGALVTSYMLLSEVRSGQLNLNKAWQDHTIVADDLLGFLALQPGWAEEPEGNRFAEFLVHHAPEHAQDLAHLGVGPKFWIGNYYRSQHDARAPAYFEPLVAAGTSSFKELKDSDFEFTRQINNDAERHIDWYYGEQGTKAPICVPRELRVTLPQGPQPVAPIRLRLLILANRGEVTATTNTDKVSLRMEMDWRANNIWYYRHKDVLVELSPAALTPGFQAMVEVKSTTAPGIVVRVPIHIGAAGTAATVATQAPAPVAPTVAGAQPNTLDALAIGAGEIRLTGTVRSVHLAQKFLVLNVTSFTLANGKTSKIETPRQKTILLSGDTQWRSRDGNDNGVATMARLKVGATLSVLGADLGSGHDLPARLVFVESAP